MQKVPVYILAGGQSRRFGTDKALAHLNGKPLLKRISEKVLPITASVTVVADRERKYECLNLRTIGDVIPNCGPMGGILTALQDRGNGWCLILSCDLVDVKLAWISSLLLARSGKAQVVAFHGTRWEPLFALYHPSICYKLYDKIQKRSFALWKLLEEVVAEAVRLPHDWPQLSQVNSRAELLRVDTLVNLSQENTRGHQYFCRG